MNRERGELPPPAYTFQETDEYVRGKEFSTGSMREGVVIGREICVRYLGREGKNLRFMFYRLENNQPVGEGTETISMFRRYKYTRTDSGAGFLFRAYTQVQYGNRPQLRFAIQNESVITKTETSGVRLKQK